MIGERPAPSDFELPEEDDDDDGASKLVKLPTTGEEWIERRAEAREEKSEIHTISENIFGSSAIAVWRRIQKPAIEHPEYLENEKSLLSKQLAHTNEQLATFRLREPNLLANFFNDYLKTKPKAKKELAAILGVKAVTEKEIFMSAFAKIASSRPSKGYKIPETMLLDMLLVHSDQEQGKQKKFINNINILKKEVRFLVMLAAGRISSVDIKIVQERISNLEIELLDPMEALIQERLGDYDPVLHQLRVSTDVEISGLKHILTHEYFHAISGLSESADVPLRWPELSSYDFQKVGLSLGRTMKKRPGTPSFEWLNEAVTEQLAAQFTHAPKQAYHEERRLLSLLLRNGLPKRVLLDAYFENYTGKKVTEHDLPKLRLFFNEGKKIFGPRFLIDLDLYVEYIDSKYDHKQKEDKLRELSDLWEQSGSEFPQKLSALLLEEKLRSK